MSLCVSEAHNRTKENVQEEHKVAGEHRTCYEQLAELRNQVRKTVHDANGVLTAIFSNIALAQIYRDTGHAEG